MSTAPSAFPSQPSPTIDFMTLAEAKSWIQGLNPNATLPSDPTIQFIVTAVSQDMLTKMSRTTIFNTDYQEWYDGTGTVTLPIDNDPITQVNLLKICGTPLGPSPDHIQSGYIISRDKKFIQLVGSGVAPGFGVPFRSAWGGSAISGQYDRPSFVFPYGTSNIYVDYYAGYATVPYDLQEACALIIDQDYRRRGWTDLAEVIIPNGGGTTTYRAWSIPPRAWDIIRNYTRTAR